MLSLLAEKRTIFKKDLKEARTEGKLPVVVYGAKEKSTPFFVPLKEFKKVFEEAGESTIVLLKTDGGDKDVLIHDISLHPVTDEPLHVDFYVIEKGKKIRVSVPFKFTGEAPAIKAGLGTLVKALHEVEIEVLPKDLPQHIEVDLNSLSDVGDHVQIKDLNIPIDVTILIESNETVASIAAQKEEEEEVVEAPDMESIEVEQKGKKEDSDTAGEENAKDKGETQEGK